jgi:hypothetical protein
MPTMKRADVYAKVTQPSDRKRSQDRESGSRLRVVTPVRRGATGYGEAGDQPERSSRARGGFDPAA